MYYFSIICYALLGGVGLYLILFSVAYLFKYVMLIMFRNQTTGVVVGYEEHTHYSYETSRRLIRKYYPCIEFYYDSNKYIGIAKNAKRNRKKQYQIGIHVQISYHSKFPDFFVIDDNHKNPLIGFIPFAFGISYFIILYWIFTKFFLPLTNDTNIYYVMFLAPLVCVTQIIRVVLFSYTGRIYKFKSWVIPIQGVVTLALSCVLAILHNNIFH